MTAMPPQLWVYRSRVVRVVDGDTVDIEIDAGFRSHRIERIRLLGVNAPEVKGISRLDGDAATAYVRAWLSSDGSPDAWPLRIQTEKSDSFGRYLGRLWRISDGRELNADLLDSGHAVPFKE